MLDLYFTENIGVNEKLNRLLASYLRSPFEIKRTQNGKPYIEGNPLFFSISHSGNVCALAVCDKPVGVDFELIKGKKYSSVLSSLPEKERGEIGCAEDFFRHWVAREAYIKMLGSTLADKLNSLSFTGGTLYDGNNRADCELSHGAYGGGVFAVCIDNAK